MEPEESSKKPRRITEGAYVLGAVAVIVLLLSLVYARNTKRETEESQAHTEGMVKEVNKFAAEIKSSEDQMRDLFDPLVYLAELDKRLEAAGLPPLSGKDFAAQLAEKNNELLKMASGRRYIDLCKQVTQVEMHFLYEGGRRPKKGLPGWAPTWEKDCPSVLAPVSKE